ncbi:hypothetical protein Y1Q_0014852 [Alligator mississippiensis]|uniref:Uncharacterized protein n=1 Tax=Alligator mississippiensis TaxID=8496 RepID=A0A151M7M4_ALLMI|nr:hypothetical protein Y1Q_0014852 [Alligator mississippiensis]
MVGQPLSLRPPWRQPRVHDEGHCLDPHDKQTERGWGWMDRQPDSYMPSNCPGPEVCPRRSWSPGVDLRPQPCGERTCRGPVGHAQKG